MLSNHARVTWCWSCDTLIVCDGSEELPRYCCRTCERAMRDEENAAGGKDSAVLVSALPSWWPRRRHDRNCRRIARRFPLCSRVKLAISAFKTVSRRATGATVMLFVRVVLTERMLAAEHDRIRSHRRQSQTPVTPTLRLLMSLESIVQETSTMMAIIDAATLIGTDALPNQKDVKRSVVRLRRLAQILFNRLAQNTP